MFKIKLLFGVAAVLTASGTLLLAAGPAAARDVTVIAQLEDDVPVARVTDLDLDLARPTGQQALRHRVAGAVRTVCAPAQQGLDFTAYAVCQNSAWGEAKPQMVEAIARAGRLAAGTASGQDWALALNTAIRFGAR